ncbi:hypothetical protein ACRYCC_10505 [Actinomadura scrupuli]|uniref:hypothetical protein n=1 Tax=Actinomadura scrupuli TaxID=559629 RepID=UPI003D98153F
MDPVTIGLTVAALLAAKYAEGVAGEAGKVTWTGITSLRSRVRAAVSDDEKAQADLEVLESGDTTKTAAIATAIEGKVSRDEELRRDLSRMIEDASKSQSTAAIVAHAYDTAKQINIGGDNSGNITM